jgi:hypothetical protein
MSGKIITLKGGKSQPKQKFTLFKEKNLDFVFSKALKAAHKMDLVSNLFLTI